MVTHDIKNHKFKIESLKGLSCLEYDLTHVVRLALFLNRTFRYQVGKIVLQICHSL